MAYTKDGYYLMARTIQDVTAQYYEPGNHAKCYKQVWKKYIHPHFGYCYNTYLKYLKARKPIETTDDRQLKLNF